MKTVILAGGRGTRLAEETAVIPKPMVEIGGRPMLWHIMKIYAHHGHTDFLIACGYKGEVIKSYFGDFRLRDSDYVIDLGTGDVEFIRPGEVDWKVGLIDTGLDTMTGGRVRRLRKLVGDETFMVTYGDGVGNVDVAALLDFHRSHVGVATVTAVRPPARFGDMSIEDDRVESFEEKPQMHEGWINGGFFVFEPKVFDYIEGDSTSLEHAPLSMLAAHGELYAFRHRGFWQPMDTLRERQLLQELWASGEAPWRVW